MAGKYNINISESSLSGGDFFDKIVITFFLFVSIMSEVSDKMKT